MTKEDPRDVLHDVAVELTRMQRVNAALLRRIDDAVGGGKIAAGGPAESSARSWDRTWARPVQVDEGAEEEADHESTTARKEDG